MENNISNSPKAELKALAEKKITRKEALKKSGFMALSAATMVVLLNDPAKGQTTSPKTAPVAPDNKNSDGSDAGIWND